MLQFKSNSYLLRNNDLHLYLNRKGRNRVLKELFIKFGELRKARGWSQYDIAEKTRIHQSQIGALEAGKTASVTRIDDFIAAYSKAFGISVPDLIGLNAPISHLSKDIQDFIKNPANADKLKRLWLEEELKRLNQETADKANP